MIVAIEGEVVYKEPTILHIKVGGLTYEVQVSLNCSAQIDKKQVSLYIKQILREDANLLFGFLDKEEKALFEALLKINGVGPKVALAICSTFKPETFAKIVESKDVAMLKRVPGIGPKAANRILVELGDISFLQNQTSKVAIDNEAYQKAIMALESLGFKKDAINKALKNESGTVEELIKIALKKLQRL